MVTCNMTGLIKCCASLYSVFDNQVITRTAIIQPTYCGINEILFTEIKAKLGAIKEVKNTANKERSATGSVDEDNGNGSQLYKGV